MRESSLNLSTKNKLLIAIILLLAFSVAIAFNRYNMVSATTTTTTVTPNDMATSPADVLADPTSWLFYNDETDTIDNSLGSFVSGPGSPPAGSGSVQISVTGTQRRNLATYQFSGTKLSDITELKFSTYNPSIGNGGSATRSGYLNFNVTFDGVDNWQRRLVFLPADNGVVSQNNWQEWDAINGGNALYRYSGATWPSTAIPGTTPRSLSDLLNAYPSLAIRTTDSWLGVRVGEPYADGYTENIDKFVFGTASGIKVFNFDPVVGPPTSKNQCKNNGWMAFNNPAFSSKKQCEKFVKAKAEGKLEMSNPSQKIKFNIANNTNSNCDDDDDDEHSHHNWFNWHHHKNKRNTVEYWNYDYPGVLHYKADVTCTFVNPATNEARFMFQIPAGHPGLSGLYVVAYVKEVKNGPDLYGHSATADLATATQWCQTGVGFSPTMYTVTKGKVHVE